MEMNPQRCDGLLGGWLEGGAYITIPATMLGAVNNASWIKIETVIS